MYQQNLLFMILGSVISAYGVGCVMMYVAVLTNLFKTEVRFSGIAVCDNIAFIFAGFIPVLILSLYNYSKNMYIPVFLMIFISIIGIVASLDVFFSSSYKKKVSTGNNIL